MSSMQSGGSLCHYLLQMCILFSSFTVGTWVKASAALLLSRTLCPNSCLDKMPIDLSTNKSFKTKRGTDLSSRVFVSNAFDIKPLALDVSSCYSVALFSKTSESFPRNGLFYIHLICFSQN